MKVLVDPTDSAEVAPTDSAEVAPTDGGLVYR